MRRVVMVCDRCGADIEGTVHRIVTLTKGNERNEQVYNKQYDLCADCDARVLEFLSNNNK